MERTKKREPEMNGSSNFFLTSLIGGGIGLGVTLLLVLLLPFAVLGFDDPNAFALPSACVCALAGSAVGSFFAVGRCKESPIAAALTASGVILVPMLIVSFFISGEFSIVGVLTVIGSIAAGSVLTSLLLTRTSKSRKRRMKNVMKRR